MRVLLAQLDPAPGDVAANLAALEATLATHPAAQLAVFPELYLCGYRPADARACAQPADGPALDALSAAAAAHATALVVGFAERHAGGVANAVACVDADGSRAGVYRKAHLFGAAERAAFTAGEGLLVVTLAGVSVAPLICFDVEFPEPARSVSRAGAQLLVTVAANMAPYGPDHALAARARALDNRRAHVYVNRAGSDGGHAFVGQSAVIAPDGVVVASLGADPDTLELPLRDLHRRPEPEIDYLAQLRDDLPVARAAPALQGGCR